MEAFLVVDAVDVGIDAALGFFNAAIVAKIDVLVFEGSKKSLNNNVVYGATFGIPRDSDIVFKQDPFKMV